MSDAQSLQLLSLEWDPQWQAYEVTYSGGEGLLTDSENIPGQQFPRDMPPPTGTDASSARSFTDSLRTTKLTTSIKNAFPNAEASDWIPFLMEVTAGAVTHCLFFASEIEYNGIWTLSKAGQDSRMTTVAGGVLSSLIVRKGQVGKFSFEEKEISDAPEIHDLENIIDRDIDRILRRMCQITRQMLMENYTYLTKDQNFYLSPVDSELLNQAIAQTFILDKPVKLTEILPLHDIPIMWPQGLHIRREAGIRKKITHPFCSTIITLAYERCFYGDESSVANIWSEAVDKYPLLANKGARQRGRPWIEEGTYAGYCLVVVLLTKIAYDLLDNVDRPLWVWENAFRELLSLIPRYTVRRLDQSEGMPLAFSLQAAIKAAVDHSAKKLWEDNLRTALEP